MPSRPLLLLTAIFLIALVIVLPTPYIPVETSNRRDMPFAVRQILRDSSPIAKSEGRHFTESDPVTSFGGVTIVSAVAMWHSPQLELSVRIQGGTGWVHASAIRALEEWNHEEALFIQDYYSNESYSLEAACAANPTPACVQGSQVRNFANGYVFYEDERTMDPMVNVLFSPICSKETAAIEHASSELAITGFDGTRFTISVLSALTNVPNNATSRDVLYRIMLHEFGHVMGLGHIYDGKDIMDGNAYFLNDPAKRSYISTIDLYALRELAKLGSGVLKPFSFITLPSTIPYRLINVDQS
ncbi:MAG TPA: hypothetical protein VJZ32_10355 [Candidatus Bathyarchaeia archaeon]|nr:hypothetical protein [Candidatus Bathyarchaeia archaeon]